MRSSRPTASKEVSSASFAVASLRFGFVQVYCFFFLAPFFLSPTAAPRGVRRKGSSRLATGLQNVCSSRAKPTKANFNVHKYTFRPHRFTFKMQNYTVNVEMCTVDCGRGNVFCQSAQGCFQSAKVYWQSFPNIQLYFRGKKTWCQRIKE